MSQLACWERRKTNGKSQLLLSEVAALAAKQSYCQSLQIDDETLEILTAELRKGLLADRHTTRDTLRRAVTKVEIKTAEERSTLDHQALYPARTARRLPLRRSPYWVCLAGNCPPASSLKNSCARSLLCYSWPCGC
jgi:hypothetical protein